MYVYAVESRQRKWFTGVRHTNLLKILKIFAAERRLILQNLFYHIGNCVSYMIKTLREGSRGG